MSRVVEEISAKYIRTARLYLVNTGHPDIQADEPGFPEMDVELQ